MCLSKPQWLFLPSTSKSLPSPELGLAYCLAILCIHRSLKELRFRLQWLSENQIIHSVPRYTGQSAAGFIWILWEGGERKIFSALIDFKFTLQVFPVPCAGEWQFHNTLEVFWASVHSETLRISPLGDKIQASVVQVCAASIMPLESPVKEHRFPDLKKKPMHGAGLQQDHWHSYYGNRQRGQKCHSSPYWWVFHHKTDEFRTP